MKPLGDPGDSAHPSETGEFLGYIMDVPCYRCKLRGNGLLDANSNWRLWKADIKVYRAATANIEGARNPISTSSSNDHVEVFESKEVGMLVKMDRVRKAVMWFTISEALREKHLTDLDGTDKSAEDVLKRIHERVAPEGTPYEPLDELVIPQHSRKQLQEAEKKTVDKPKKKNKRRTKKPKT